VFRNPLARKNAAWLFINGGALLRMADLRPLGP